MYFSNDSTFDESKARVATSQENVTISSPYNMTAVSEIVPYMSNTTNLTLSPAIWSGKYAILQIVGTQETSLTNETGATVAEWGIIGGG